MKLEIVLTRKEFDHLLGCEGYVTDACENTCKIMDKIKAAAKEKESKKR